MLDTKALAAVTAAIVREHLEKEMAPLLKRIAELEARQPLKGDKGDPGERGNDGLPGKDADMILIEGMIDAATYKAIEEAWAKIQMPKDGRDGVDGENGVNGKDGETGPAGERGEKGESGGVGPKGEKGDSGDDGVGLAGMLIDRDGNLVATMTDGSTKALGPVVGKDGAPGRDGADGRDGAAGLDGANGKDGLGFDDLDFDIRDDGAFLRFMRGDQVKEFRLPIVMDRGVYSAEKTYQAGDGVTWGGSFWIAQDETTEKPDSGKGWRLAVKKGRDGRDGTVKPDNGSPKVKI